MYLAVYYRKKQAFLVNLANQFYPLRFRIRECFVESDLPDAGDISIADLFTPSLGYVISITVVTGHTSGMVSASSFFFNFSVWTKNVLTTFSSISIIDPFSLTPTFASQPGSTTPPHLLHGFCFCKSLRYFTRSDSRGPGGLHEGGRQQAQDLPPVRPDKHGTRQVGQHWRNDIPQMYREQLLGLKGCKTSCKTRSCNMNVIWKTALNVAS